MRELKVERMRIPFITPETAEVTKAITIIAAIIDHRVAVDFTAPPVRLLVPSATRNMAEPMLAAMPQTSANRQMTSTTGVRVSVIF